MDTYCLLGSLHGTPHQRFGIVRDGSIVSVQISKPEGTMVPLDGLVYRTEQKAQVEIRSINAQTFTYSKNGEQPRKVWNRVKKAAA